LFLLFLFDEQISWVLFHSARFAFIAFLKLFRITLGEVSFLYRGSSILREPEIGFRSPGLKPNFGSGAESLNAQTPKMNIVPTYQEAERPEPFATILEMLGEHPVTEVLEAIADNAQFESEDEENCADYRKYNARLALELNQLLERMAD
jgi:hypothetical protein